MMYWDKLLSLKRFGDVNKRLRKEQDETRLGFEVDYDRIIFSESFRSLQDKTQVIPLSKTDFVHTRLTHSLEVSVVARSLGRLVGKEILKKHPNLAHDLGYKATDFGAIVAAASLAHDIGNPPFGHSGEKAIGEFFSTGKGKQYKDQLTAKEYEDLTRFEGNANGFHLVSRSLPGQEGGLRLSYATLGAFMKYPKESLPYKPSQHIAHKKYGFFQNDKAFFIEVAEELGLKQIEMPNSISYARHPLAYLVEAADDICYTLIDFEDGINLGLINEDFALEYLIKLVKGSINIKKYHTLTSTKSRVAYLRSLAISTLINEAVSVFIENEIAILEGEYPYSLLDKCKYESQINDIIAISVKNVYESKEVINKEIAGYSIIEKLLGVYTNSVNNLAEGKVTSYDRLILKTIPLEIEIEKSKLYDRLLYVSNYIASLTDSKALFLYQELIGLRV